MQGRGARGASRLLLASAVLAMVSLTTSAQAANSNHFGVGPASARFFFTDHPELIPSGGFSFRGVGAVGAAPLTCRGPLLGDTATVVNGVGIAGLHLGWGVADFLELSASVPAMAMWVDRTAETPHCPSSTTANGPLLGMNDPLLRARVAVVAPRRDRPFTLTAEMGFRVPFMGILGQGLRTLPPPTSLALSPETAELFGDEWGSSWVGINPGFRFRFVRLAAELGLLLRPRSRLLGSTFGSEVFGSAGGELHSLVPGFYFVGDLSARVGGNLDALAPALSSSTWNFPVEAMGGVRFRYDFFAISAGVGLGVLPGYGTPSARFVLGLGFEGYEDRFGSRPLFDISEWLLKLPQLFLGGVKVGPSSGKKRAGKKKRRTGGRGSAAKKFECPDEMTPDHELYYDPRCPRPDLVAEDDDEDVFDDSELDDILGTECPVCPRRDHHSHELAYIVHVYFELDQAVLDDAERQRIVREVTAPPAHARLTSVSVVGHADEVGDTGYNLELSERRTAHVAEILTGLGVSPALIVEAARGEDDPLVPNRDPQDGTLANRRVRIMLRYFIETGPRAATPDARPNDEGEAHDH